ncbi:hypothetical protein EV644_105481 [Kribbella orskensis]|uniref:Uncharacterized protein n=1 Tax=Kribbella orskensis TaxID=2512216 RepID=A0ABY2BM27_9ACTN|nr:hypothetical protein EV642_104481 [Kribbella sp. VKM Ac-2500]TCO24447.1 hypothetical protein EV644_105481 [Kribbella orskensis]
MIRGEEHLPLNPSLAYATSRGMQLTYLDRTSYRDQRSEEVIAPLRERFGESLCSKAAAAWAPR